MALALLAGPERAVTLAQEAAVELKAPVGGARRGSLSKEVIRRVINRSIHEVRTCAERALERNPIPPNVKVRFVIGPKGTVQEASILESKTGDKEANACVLDVFRGLRFPPPEGGGIVVVTYPVIVCLTGG